MLRIVGVGEILIDDDPKDTVMTFALGSCVALTIYAPSRKVLGMAHIALPDSSINPMKSLESPGYFADTAVPVLVEKFLKHYHCRGWELNIRLYGGAATVWGGDAFQIGTRNIETIEAILRGYRLSYDASQIGGRFSRTIAAAINDGKVKVHQQPLYPVQSGSESNPEERTVLPN